MWYVYFWQVIFFCAVMLQTGFTWLNRKYFANFEQVKAIAVLYKTEISWKIYVSFEKFKCCFWSYWIFFEPFARVFSIAFSYSIQKQLFADFLQNRCSWKFRNIHRKHLRWSLFLIKLQVLTLFRMCFFGAAQG